MLHSEILKIFNTIFRDITPNIDAWFSNGKDSIRVRLKDGSDFIFTYHDSEDWCYETLDSYINKMRGGSRMDAGLYDNINKK